VFGAQIRKIPDERKLTGILSFCPCATISILR
jgi:hypothetical protein